MKTNNKTILYQINDKYMQQQKKFGERKIPCLNPKLLQRTKNPNPKQLTDNYEMPSLERTEYNLNIAVTLKNLSYSDIAVNNLSEIISTIDIYQRREKILNMSGLFLSWLKNIDKQINN